VPVLPVSDIRVAIRRGQTSIEVQWPESAARDCVVWLRELLR
jgi:transposase